MSLAAIVRDPSRRVAAQSAVRAAIAQKVGSSDFVDAITADIRARLHARQREMFDLVVFGRERFVAAECGRRSGKTTGSAAIYVVTLAKCVEGEEMVFVAPTLARGKELIWHWMLMFMASYGLDTVWRMNANSGKIWNTRGGMFRIVGLDNRRQVDKVSRGGNARGFGTDETQEYAHLLDPLLVGATPALSQRRGFFLATGTPTVNEADKWASICDGGDGFVRVGWNIRDNPYFGRDAEETLREERDRYGWDEDHPIYVREWLGRRCRDHRLMVLEIGSCNLVHEIEGYDPRAWRLDASGKLPTDPEAQLMRSLWVHWIGIDFGSHDPTAWTTLASPRSSKNLYAVHFEQAPKLTWDQVAQTTHTLCRRFRPESVVGDSATGGRQFIDTFNARYASELGVWAKHADKHEKLSSIEVWNTELRTGRFAWLLPATDESYVACSALQFEDETRQTILEGSAYPEDPFDSCRYVFNEARSWHTTKQDSADDETKRRMARNARARAQGHRR